MSKQKKLITTTNGHNGGPQETPAFMKRGELGVIDWWHIEPANTDYWSVHEAHGRALARDAIRYMRENNADHMLGFVAAAMMQKTQDWRVTTVAQGFMSQIGEVLCSVKKVNIRQ